MITAVEDPGAVFFDNGFSIDDKKKVPVVWIQHENTKSFQLNRAYVYKKTFQRKRLHREKLNKI